MTLLIALTAAVAVTVVWYSSPKARQLKIGLMCYMFWGASVMWVVDALSEYKDLGAAYFTPAAVDMLNDSFLGLSVVALGCTVWLCALIISDPKGVIKDTLTRNKQQ